VNWAVAVRFSTPVFKRDYRRHGPSCVECRGGIRHFLFLDEKVGGPKKRNKE